ncbi:PucR family transcriptional regulator [Streptomyces noursei]|uniref:PucR family transcriptional regulator n=1 Tax=Streptomyces noursei TaxID=1971 RepID=UPI0019644DAA|nr:PucR family transcriptional regulator [Streptomyces noursei]QRX89967.1 helix-turn-helix domain-containing protein [Streptomyces noursei]
MEEAEVGSEDRRQALLRYVTDHAPQLAERFLSLFRAEIAEYGHVRSASLAPSVTAALIQVAHALAEQRSLGAEELDALRDYGELRARQGMPLDAVLRAWQIAVREAIAQAVVRGRETGVPDAELMNLTGDLLAATNAATLAFSTGHQEATATLARHDGVRRAEFLRRLLLDENTEARIRIDAQQFGLQPDRTYHALRAHVLGDGGLLDLEAALSRHPACRPPAGLVALVDDEVIGLSDRIPNVPANAVLGAGPKVPLDGLPSSIRAATRTVTTAHAFAIPGTHRLEDLGLLPAVMADTDIGDAMVRRYLAPIGEGGAASALLATVDRYLECGMHIGRTAEAMVVHENTVRYRLTRYESLTGASLRDTHTALQIWWALRRSHSLRSG